MTYSNRSDRFTQSVTDAMFGYMAAATASYLYVTSESLRAWADAAEEIDPNKAKNTRPKSWYRPPPPSTYESTKPTSVPWNKNPFMGNPWIASAWMASPMFPAAMTIWPTAMTLMEAGVPRQVAWPLAEAATAHQDAAAIALDSINELSDAYATYRSSGGHASASVET